MSESPNTLQEDLKESAAMAKIAYQALENKMGEDIRILDIHEVSVLADYFLIALGRNPNHVRALLDEVEEQLAKAGYEPSDKEGFDTCTWGLMDYQRIIIHVFSQEARVFYNLERIWSDGQKVDPETL